jgi:hypothetical protein
MNDFFNVVFISKIIFIKYFIIQRIDKFINNVLRLSLIFHVFYEKFVELSINLTKNSGNSGL